MKSSSFRLSCYSSPLSLRPRPRPAYPFSQRHRRPLFLDRRRPPLPLSRPSPLSPLSYRRRPPPRRPLPPTPLIPLDGWF